MKISHLSLLALISLLLISAAPLPQDLQNEESAIRTAVEDQYIKGLQTRDFSLIRKIFIPDGKLMGSRPNGEFRVMTLDQWSTHFDPANPPFKELKAEIVKVEIVGSVAQVRIDFIIDGTRHITDFLNMVKFSGNWRIVNIVDH